MWVVLVVGAVAVVLLARSTFGRGLQPTTPTDTVFTEPTGSAWNEKVPDSPPPSPTAPDPNAGQQILCLQVDIRTVPSANASWLTAASLSIPTPLSGTNAAAISRLLTNATAYTCQYPGSTWASFLSIGRAPASEGFTDPATMARRVTECHLTGSRFRGYESHKVLVLEAITVDGRQGYRVQIHSVNSCAPGGGTVFDAVAPNAGNPVGLSIYWGRAVGADADVRSMPGQAEEDLRIA